MKRNIHDKKCLDSEKKSKQRDVFIVKSFDFLELKI